MNHPHKTTTYLSVSVIIVSNTDVKLIDNHLAKANIYSD